MDKAWEENRRIIEECKKLSAGIDEGIHNLKLLPIQVIAKTITDFNSLKQDLSVMNQVKNVELQQEKIIDDEAERRREQE